MCLNTSIRRHIQYPVNKANSEFELNFTLKYDTTRLYFVGGSLPAFTQKRLSLYDCIWLVLLLLYFLPQASLSGIFTENLIWYACSEE